MPSTSSCVIPSASYDLTKTSMRDREIGFNWCPDSELKPPQAEATEEYMYVRKSVAGPSHSYDNTDVSWDHSKTVSRAICLQRQRLFGHLLCAWVRRKTFRADSRAFQYRDTHLSPESVLDFVHGGVSGFPYRKLSCHARQSRAPNSYVDYQRCARLYNYLVEHGWVSDGRNPEDLERRSFFQ